MLRYLTVPLGLLTFSTPALATPDLSWSYVGTIPNAYDIAVCDNGYLFALVANGDGIADVSLRRTSSTVFSTGFTSTVFQESMNGATHISCSTDTYVSPPRPQMLSVWSGGGIYSQYSDNASSPDFTWPGGSSPFQYKATASWADDVKALGAWQSIAHSTDRYDYLGSDNSSRYTSFSYLGDMWGAKEIAANGSGQQIAFAANDGVYDFYVNRPTSGIWTLDSGWELVNGTPTTRLIAYLTTDIEAARAGSTVFVYALVSGGQVWKGTLSN